MPALGQAPAGSGTGSWYTATTYSVKPGMMEQFRQLVIKEYIPAAKKGGATQIQSWRFATGNSDRVLRIVGPLMRVRADGSGTTELLVSEAQLEGNKVAGSWSADGRLLTIQHSGNVVVRDAEGVFHPMLTTAANEREARFSPNGQWFSYRSDETGRWEVYVQSYPPGNGKWQISTDGGAQAMWAPNGRELFVLNGNRMMAADVAPGPTFKAGKPRALFEMSLAETAPDDSSRYGVTPDAQRFLVLTMVAEEKAATPPLTVVLNYAQALKR